MIVDQHTSESTVDEFHTTLKKIWCTRLSSMMRLITSKLALKNMNVLKAYSTLM